MKKQWMRLWVDERPIKRRALVTALVVFAFVFTFLIFGVMDLYLSNLGNFEFLFWEMAVPVILMGLFTGAAMFGVLLFFRGKLLDILLSLCAGITMAGYLQGNFLNMNLGDLTGEEIRWEKYLLPAVLNLLVWGIITVLPLLVRYFSSNAWKKLIIFIPVLLVGMQAPALAMGLASADLQLPAKDRMTKYLASDTLYEVSSKDNIFVFLLDTMDNDVVEEVIGQDPEFFAPLDGFTRFTDVVSVHCRTYPSLAYTVTGEEIRNDDTYAQYLDRAHTNSTFFKDIKAQGYKVNFFATKNFGYSNPDLLEGVVDNMKEASLSVNVKNMMAKLYKFSAFRYAPQSLKSNFWMSHDSFDKVVTAEETTPKYSVDDYKFYQDLKAQGLSVQEETGTFSFFYLNGPHRPYTITENLELVEANTIPMSQQMKGSMKILYEYLDQMKALGVYEDATIIILTDHPATRDYEEFSHHRACGLFVKPAGSFGEPLKENSAPVSNDNFRATVIEAAGGNPEQYGKTYFEVKEGEEVVRRFYFQALYHDTLEEYEIRGDAKELENYEKVSESKMFEIP